MELKQYTSVVWKWGWLIVLATLVAAVCSYWASSRMPRIYQATTTLMAGQFIHSSEPTEAQIKISERLAESYVQLARLQPVLEAAGKSLGLKTGWQGLAGQVQAARLPNTELLKISVVDTDPQRAAALANEVARQLILQSPTTPDQQQEERRQFVNRQLADLEAKIDNAKKQADELEGRLALETGARGIQDTQNQITALQQKIFAWQSAYASLLQFSTGSPTNYLTVVQPASVPTTPISPRTRTNVLLAAAIGCLLALAAAFLLEYLDDTLKTAEDVERVLDLPTLGGITHIRAVAKPPDNLVTLRHPRSPIAEGYRVLRTNLEFACLGNESARLLVTSAGPAEGKTTTACNLGVTMAQGGRRVIVLDTDLRRPFVHRFFDVPNQVGLTSLLRDAEMPVATALAETGVDGLSVLPSGPLPPNPAELLRSKRMRTRVEEIMQLAEVAIFDSPPVLAVADASILGALCDGVILVVQAGRTRSEVVRLAKDTLEQVGLKVLGVTLNKLSGRRGGYYYYYYYYSSDGDRRRRDRNGSGSGVRGLGRLPWLAQLLNRKATNVAPASPEIEDGAPPGA